MTKSVRSERSERRAALASWAREQERKRQAAECLKLQRRGVVDAWQRFGSLRGPVDDPAGPPDHD
jgi:hypothetical protein